MATAALIIAIIALLFALAACSAVGPNKGR